MSKNNIKYWIVFYKYIGFNLSFKAADFSEKGTLVSYFYLVIRLLSVQYGWISNLVR